MSYKTFKIARILITIFIAATVSVAVVSENMYLAFAAVIVGIISMLFIKKNVKAVTVDEMVKTISGKSALMAYSISTIALAAVSLFLVFSNLGDKGAEAYNLGITLSYVVLFEMFVYSFAYYYYNRKYGRDDE